MRGTQGSISLWKWWCAARFFCVFLDTPHLKQILSCAHTHACDILPSGEAMVLACFSFRKISEKSVEINPRFCYNIGVSLCSCAGVKNPRWQADT